MRLTEIAKNSIAVARLAAMVVLAGALLSGCGSTKVHTADKSIVYRDAIYNLGNVQMVGSRAEVKKADGEAVPASSLDKDGFKALLEESDEVLVTTFLVLDDRDVVFERNYADSYSDYSKMLDRQESAMRSITRFMSDSKETQLKLD